MKNLLLFILNFSVIFAVYGQGVEIDPDKITIDTTIVLNGSGTADGGEITIRTKDGDNRLRLLSQLNTTTNTGGYIDLYNGSNVQTVVINGHNNTNGAGRITLSDATGETKIILVANYNGTGDGRIITDEIEIQGGSDLAEMFDVITNDESTVTPGMLVSLDPAHPGKLMISNEAYDQKVAGIISGANGIKAGILMGLSLIHI